MYGYTSGSQAAGRTLDWWKGPVASVEALNSIWSQIGGVHPQARMRKARLTVAHCSERDTSSRSSRGINPPGLLRLFINTFRFEKRSLFSQQSGRHPYFLKAMKSLYFKTL